MINSVVEVGKLGFVREIYFPVDNVEGVDDEGGGEDGGSDESPDETSERSERLPESAGHQRFPRHHDRLFSARFKL